MTFPQQQSSQLAQVKLHRSYVPPVKLFPGISQFFSRGIKLGAEGETLLRKSFRPVGILKHLLCSLPYNIRPLLHLLTVDNEVPASPHPLEEDAPRFHAQQRLDAVGLFPQNARSILLFHCFAHATRVFAVVEYSTERK